MKKMMTLAALLSAVTLSAQAQDISKGPVIKDFGENAPVQMTTPLNTEMVYKVSYDVAAGSKPGEMNRALNSPARFLNMMVRNGVPQDNMKMAVVIHGTATMDVTKDSFYQEKMGGPNGNIELIKALTDSGIRVILCGQSAAFRGVTNEDLLPGVEMALSAMTIHTDLQNQGYKVIPR